MKPIRVLFEIPDEFVPQARYALGFLSSSWGLKVEVTCDPSHRPVSSLVYSCNEPSLRRGDPVVVPFDPSLYDPFTACRAGEMEDRPIWMREGAGEEQADLIGAVFRLLTWADESQIRPSKLDSFGNFMVSDLPKERGRAAGLPLADHGAAILLDMLLSTAPALREIIVPRWPEGKSYAVCLSHDTDAVHIGHPREMAFALAKWVFRRKKIYWEMIRSGLTHMGTPADNPYWGFPGWREFESSRGIKSCFYLSVPPQKCGRHIHDCRSTVFDRWVDWGPLRSMNSEGWEFGLHAAINTRHHPEEYLLERRAIEERIGAPIEGIRHHYLAIDRPQRHYTFREHIQAGFAYDSSVGWQRRAGFRAGTCTPFQPYDPEYKRPLDMVEIPLCLMDNYILNEWVDDPVRAGGSMISLISSVGGVVTFNWHTETYAVQPEFKGYQRTLERILDPLLSDPTAWFATPIEVARWWRKRMEALRNG